MTTKTKFDSILSSERFSAIKIKAVSVLKRLGIVALIGTTVGGYSIQQGIAYGGDHLRRAWDQQSYFLFNAFSAVSPDVVILYSCDWATAGNIVTLYNQENAGESTARADRSMQVISVSFGGKKFRIGEAVGAVTVNSEYGLFTVYRSGFYTYISEQAQVDEYQSENFSIELTGRNNTTETVQLSVKAYKVKHTATTCLTTAIKNRVQIISMKAVRLTKRHFGPAQWYLAIQRKMCC